MNAITKKLARDSEPLSDSEKENVYIIGADRHFIDIAQRYFSMQEKAPEKEKDREYTYL